MRALSVFLSIAVMMSQCLPALADPGNLGSTQRTERAPDSLSNPVAILNGGRAQIIGSGAALTPAQAVALQQVMATGSQSVVLSALGNAVGGSVIFNAGTNLASLSVPRNVTVVTDFSNNAVLNIVGNLTNFGSLYGVSTNSAINTANFTAKNITNNTGALISTVLPGNGLAGFANALPDLNLTLNAVEKLINNGTISSAGNLNLSADSITNGSSGLMSANKDVNAVTNNLTNAGTIQAGNNINVTAQTVQNMIVNNAGGLLSAANAINFNNSPATKELQTSIVGGSLLSNEVNIDAGAGNGFLNVDNLSGLLNATAGSGKFGSGSSLHLGDLNISGDPTYFSNGSLTVTLPLTFDEAITLLAGGDIILSGQTIQSRDTGTQGFNITIIAGANLVASGGATAAPGGTVPPGQISTGSVKVSGPSATGGNVFGVNATIDANSLGTGQNAGNILIAAYSNGTGGNINLAGATISASALDSKAGNVTIIGTGGITLGDINMLGGSLTSAPILAVTNAQPMGSITAFPDGHTTGTITASSAISGAGNVVIGDPIGTVAADILAPGGSITIRAGGGDLLMVAGSSIRTDDPVLSLAGRNGGAITLTSANNMTLAGLIYSRGTDGFNGASAATAGVSGTNGGNGANGGKITITAAGDINENAATTIDSSGGIGGIGGNGANGAAPPANINGGNGGNAGTITISAANLDLRGSSIVAAGGLAQDAGDAGSAFGGVAAAGGNGGNGGTAGRGGNAGAITITTAAGGASALGQVDASGGNGGTGGNGGAGGSSTGDAGGRGGNAGAGGNAGLAAAIKITGGNFMTLNGDITARGGDGGFSGLAGSGAGDTTGGIGGDAANGGIASNGGAITIQSGEILYTNDPFLPDPTILINSRGGTGGRASAAGGGGDGSAGAGGRGGLGAAAGRGGNGAPISITATVTKIDTATVGQAPS